jgi:hypothetical protein
MMSVLCVDGGDATAVAGGHQGGQDQDRNPEPSNPSVSGCLITRASSHLKKKG